MFTESVTSVIQPVLALRRVDALVAQLQEIRECVLKLLWEFSSIHRIVGGSQTNLLTFFQINKQNPRVVTYVYLVVFVGMNTYLQITYFTQKSSFW